MTSVVVRTLALLVLLVAAPPAQARRKCADTSGFAAAMEAVEAASTVRGCQDAPEVRQEGQDGAPRSPRRRLQEGVHQTLHQAVHLRAARHRRVLPGRQQEAGQHGAEGGEVLESV